MVGKLTASSMIALKRVSRCLKGTQELVNELEMDQEVDKHELKLDGFLDVDCAGSLSQAVCSSSMARLSEPETVCDSDKLRNG